MTGTHFPLTWLYAPGDRPAVVQKALVSGADVVIVDLEDAVAPDRKAYALAATADLLSDPHPVPIHVRVHTPRDIPPLVPLPGLRGLRVPKVTHATDIQRIAEVTSGLPLYALLENALAVERAYTIATAHPSVHGIALGEADLRADLGVREDCGLDWSRGRLVVAARAAALPPPVQSVHPDIRDLDSLAAGCARGRAMGFLGRAAIHPRQLPVIEQAYLPSPDEVAAAEEVVKASQTEEGALALPDGRFVDAAVVEGARRVLTLAARAA
ncbi:aldolase/citrate lyase family protein [Streptomyces sp. Je 1-79]|uniref:HpcH/HpaI aldolase/citrate lyase family protein n=1 Tax=Streptomyces sp. Je 1-79 TaxID=2943847 RepID=UPI0021A797F3|nr:aldolase/citrate lyase family protein [Streptomyces sp. Je 1-79]MCT4355179.1 aldolase/citrate lyase family protein [Streptomyces sp. Je 1-79]